MISGEIFSFVFWLFSWNKFYFKVRQGLKMAKNGLELIPQDSRIW